MGGPPPNTIISIRWGHCVRHVEMIRFWNRVLKMDENRIACRIFDYHNKLCKGNWYYEMKQLFCNVNNNI